MNKLKAAALLLLPVLARDLNSARASLPIAAAGRQKCVIVQAANAN